MAGVTPNCIRSYVRHQEKGDIPHSERYVAVLVEEDEYEN